MIPPRFSREAVNRYRETMSQMLSVWPEPLVLTPQSLSMETFRSRFRDAMTGVVEFDSGDPVLKQSLLAIGAPSSVMVAEQDGALIIGPKVTILARRKAARAGAPANTSITPGIAETDPTATLPPSLETQLLSAIILLITHGILKSMTLSGISEDTIWPLIPSDSSVSVDTLPDGTVCLY